MVGKYETCTMAMIKPTYYKGASKQQDMHTTIHYYNKPSTTMMKNPVPHNGTKNTTNITSSENPRQLQKFRSSATRSQTKSHAYSQKQYQEPRSGNYKTCIDFPKFVSRRSVEVARNF